MAGILAITAAVFLLSLADGLVKAFSGIFGLGQMLALRSGIAAVFLITAGLWLRGRTYRFGLPGRWVVARSLCLTAMWLCYYAALPAMPFATAAACFYTSPIWMSLLYAIILRRPVGPAGWCAVALGFAGVLAMLRPGLVTLTPWMALPLCAAFLYALAALMTQTRCRSEDPLSVAVTLNVALSASGFALLTAVGLTGSAQEESFMFSVWPPLNVGELLVLAGSGLMMALVTALVVCAYQLAPAPTVGLFDNGYLIFAALWGFLLFTRPPGMADIVGMALIGSGALLSSRARTEPHTAPVT